MISARVDEIEGVKAAIAGGAQKIVFGGDRLSRTPYALSIYDEVARLCAQSDVICTFATPRVVKDDEVEQAKEYMQWCMRQVPEWAKGLPVDCEGDAAVHYGDCK